MPSHTPTSPHTHSYSCLLIVPSLHTHSYSCLLIHTHSYPYLFTLTHTCDHSYSQLYTPTHTRAFSYSHFSTFSADISMGNGDAWSNLSYFYRSYSDPLISNHAHFYSWSYLLIFKSTHRSILSFTLGTSTTHSHTKTSTIIPLSTIKLQFNIFIRFFLRLLTFSVPP